MNDDMYKQLKVGDVIVITLLHNECYKGVIDFIGHPVKMIKLKNVSDLSRNKRVMGTQIFYRSEILSVEQLQSSNDQVACETGIKCFKVEIANEYTNAAVELLKTRLSNALYIVQCDHMYHEALTLLQSREVIAVAMEGSTFGRLRPPSLLSLATEDQIFVFDLVAFGSIFKEIRQILESKHPRKIVFDSRYMVDSLLHSYKCKLESFTDLLVVHAHITKRREMITLQKCIAKYFAPINMPTEAHPNILKQRPITSDQLHLAACNVGFLHRLHGFMVHDRLLYPLVEASQEFSEAFAVNNNLADAFHDISTKSEKGLDEIDVDTLSSIGSMSISNTDTEDRSQ